MAKEASRFASMSEYIGRDVLHLLRAMPESLLNQPLMVEDTNTLFALAMHFVESGEDWVLAHVGGRTIARNRPEEFRATGTLAELVTRYEHWITSIHEVLDSLPDEEMECIVQAHPTFLVRTSNVPTTVRDCLLHAVAHSALHQGHIQLTCQFLRQHHRSDLSA